MHFSILNQDVLIFNFLLCIGTSSLHNLHHVRRLQRKGLNLLILRSYKNTAVLREQCLSLSDIIRAAFGGLHILLRGIFVRVQDIAGT
jgi:hypothetical protein